MSISISIHVCTLLYNKKPIDNAVDGSLNGANRSKRRKQITKQRKRISQHALYILSCHAPPSAFFIRRAPRLGARCHDQKGK
eukprot:6930832-Heterocapsa_arctica.AAC.1